MKWFLAFLLLVSCASRVPFVFSGKSLKQNKLYSSKLYSRGTERKEIANIFLKHQYGGLNSPENYFKAQLFTVLKPFEKIEIPPSQTPGPNSIILPPELPPQISQAEYGHIPYPSWVYWRDRVRTQRRINIQTYISDASFEGALIYKTSVRQPFYRRDKRPVERNLFISFPDELGNILSIDFYYFPSRLGYLLRVDLRPAEAFYRRIPVGTPMDTVATILGDSEGEALFHNQTLVGKRQFY